MPIRFTRPPLAALTAVAFALPAAADITPDALWQLWQQTGAQSGRSIAAASTSHDGAALRLNGVTVTQTLKDAVFTAQIDRMILSPAADGAVAVSVAADQSVRFTAHDDTEDLAARFALSGSGLTIAVTGDLDAPEYAFATDALTLDLQELLSGGTPVPAQAMLGVRDVSGTVDGTGSGTTTPLTARFSGAETTSLLVYDDPVSGAALRTESTQADIDGTLTFDPGTGNGDPARGWSLAGQVSGGAGQSTSRQTAAETGTVETAIRQDRSAIQLAYDAERVSYDIDIAGVQLALSSDQFPLPPMTFSLPEASAAVSVPLAPAAGTQTARIALTLKDLEVDDALWAMADPGHALPRTPAQLALNVEADLLVQDAPVLPGPLGTAPPPGLLPHAVRIRDLSLALADATLNAAGGFTFETAAGSQVPDVNAPVGKLDLSGTGLVTLLQRLSAAGILDPQQTMGAQMVLGMFATPGDGDSLTSQVVAEPGGALYVNGNRVR
ncbi:MAG: DUF2125 domain-containing protein [Rhodobacteraceae bacterium]|nr:DUF2125 domain-containing protein [Paracoccaceae bacterium]